jgi:glycosyltransferase involved in cell wall biosynthesis
MTRKKQKIFQLISSINLGGAENIAFLLSEQCLVDSSTLAEFTIVELYRSQTDYADAKRIELQEKKIKTYSLFKGSKRLSLVFAPFALLWGIKKEKPTIIHSHTDLPDCVLASTIRLMNLFNMTIPKIIRTIHNTELWPTHPRIAQYTESTFQNDVIVGVSKAALEAYFKIRKENKLPISSQNKVIYNGCNLSSKKESQFLINKKKINIAFCGRFEAQKGIDILLKRILKINSIFENQFVFHLIGNGSYRSEVLKLTETTTNVFLYDSVNNISDKLYVFDFIIMPSRFEGLGLVSIEASLSKVPVIASKAAGLNETLPCNWSLLFDLDSEEELLEIFVKIVNNEFDMEQLKDAAFGFANQKFTVSSMIQDYNIIYSSFC